MATPSRVDRSLDDASLFRVDLHAQVEEAQRVAYTLITAAGDLWDRLDSIERALAGPADHGGSGPLAELLERLREEPALRRAREVAA